jgi:alkanesulfonate monooxygenase SsuD/methylene tetrahydromethanopterin reductase-like flavin-dependent oxidoreductase (luciferase family)
MFEAYTLLSALAACTTPCAWAALVGGNTYRNPALLAKTVTASTSSPGPRHLGHRRRLVREGAPGLGFEFGTFTDRFEKLEEALQIIIPHVASNDPPPSTASGTR